MGATKLLTAGGGGVTLDAASTATDKTITVPADNGTLIYANSSGNVGIGTTPSSWYTGYVASQVGVNGSMWANKTTSDTNIVGIGTNQYLNASASARNYISNGYASRYEQYNSGHYWFIAPSGTAGNPITFTQAMTLDSGGNLLVGCTASPSSSVGGVLLANPYTNAPKFSTAPSTGVATAIAFYNGNGNVGAINTSGSNTSYATSSDYRLKENIAPMTGALTKVQALKPCTYTWKIDGSNGEGFIAHELAEVTPQAVIGRKDDVDGEGNPKYQSIDTSFLVATLTAAIQELKAIVDEQAARITALENK